MLISVASDLDKGKVPGAGDSQAGVNEAERTQWEWR